MYHSKKIGIFISHIFGEYQRNLCQGIMDKASEFGYTTEIFSSTDGEDVGSYSLGETSILRIPNYNEFSAVCFASGTYLQASLKESIAKTLKEKCTCPVIEVQQFDAAFPSVILDNNYAAAQLTEHMITTHHHSRICYLGCSTEKQFSVKRFRHYRSVMEKHGLSVPETSYFFCDYHPDSIHEAASHFLSAEKPPEAVICYNDRIALSLMEDFLKRGLKIPEDIAVTGFDNLLTGQKISPALSTVTFPIYEMGQTVATLLLNAIKSGSLPESTTVTAEPLYRASCGCKCLPASRTLYENQLLERISILEASVFSDIKMSSALSSVKELEEGMTLLEKFLPDKNHCRECYICLYQNWDYIPSHIQEITASREETEDPDMLVMPFAFRDGKQIPKCSFTKKNILPDYIYRDSHSSYIYSPLYFENREFGYLALSYKDNQLSFPFDFLTWIINVDRMLKNICDSRQTSLLVSHLEDIYMKDSLTGLYNRQGFSLVAEPVLRQAKEENLPLLTMVFDMDGLKTINDTFGHLEGNFAIQVLGHALGHACRENMILARLGGDEFYALAPGLNEEDAKKMIQQVSDYLENYNRLHTKKYYIRVSSGYALENPGNGMDLEEIFEFADQNMYKVKKAKTKIILK